MFRNHDGILGAVFFVAAILVSLTVIDVAVRNFGQPDPNSYWSRMPHFMKDIP